MNYRAFVERMNKPVKETNPEFTRELEGKIIEALEGNNTKTFPVQLELVKETFLGGDICEEVTRDILNLLGFNNINVVTKKWVYIDRPRLNPIIYISITIQENR